MNGPSFWVSFNDQLFNLVCCLAGESLSTTQKSLSQSQNFQYCADQVMAIVDTLPQKSNYHSDLFIPLCTRQNIESTRSGLDWPPGFLAKITEAAKDHSRVTATKHLHQQRFMPG